MLVSDTLVLELLNTFANLTTAAAAGLAASRLRALVKDLQSTRHVLKEQGNSDRA